MDEIDNWEKLNNSKIPFFMAFIVDKKVVYRDSRGYDIPTKVVKAIVNGKSPYESVELVKNKVSRRTLDGIWIPESILINEGLSRKEMYLLADIASFDTYWKSRQKVADMLNVHIVTISNMLRKLVKMGFIQEVGHVFNRKIYCLTEDARIMFEEMGLKGIQAKAPKFNPPQSESKKVDDSSIEGELVDKEDEILQKINATLGGNRLLITPSRKQKVKARLKIFSEEQILEAARRLSHSKWHMGDNPSHKKYATVDFLLRNDEKVEEWLNDRSEEANIEDVLSRVIF